MTPAVKVALIVCGTLIVITLVCCSGLLVLNERTPPPSPSTTQMPYPWESKK